MSWSDANEGPISIPPRGVVYGAATAVAVAALVGIGIGFRAGWRDGGRTPFGSSDQSQGVDSAIIAKPIVDIPQVEQQAPANTVASNAAADSDDEDSNAIAEKAAAAQALQSKPVTTTPTIDDVEASPTEKPAAAAKPSTDEGEPGAPVKTDVPF
ncbi:MAG TPA: hypothetical protein VME40_14715 [Caulobacteraceae bacterium]|nr:hypothetical protein [Caulobacteraceae bacterium]